MPHATMEILTNGWNVLIILLGFGVLIFIHEPATLWLRVGQVSAAKVLQWAWVQCLAHGAPASVGERGPPILPPSPALGNLPLR